MATATKNDVTPPVEPVYEVTLTLTEQEAKDLTVVLGMLPTWGKAGNTILGVFSALTVSGYDYTDILNAARRFTDEGGEDRYQEFHDWVLRADG